MARKVMLYNSVVMDQFVNLTDYLKQQGVILKYSPVNKVCENKADKLYLFLFLL